MQKVEAAGQSEGLFSSLRSASFRNHLSGGSANLLAFVPSQAGDSRDMSRELQDVDLAEVKPLVEKGEVSGDAPGPPITCTVIQGHTCVHNMNTYTHVSTTSLFPRVSLSRCAEAQRYLFQAQRGHYVLWHCGPGPCPQSGLLCPHLPDPLCKEGH